MDNEQQGTNPSKPLGLASTPDIRSLSSSFMRDIVSYWSPVHEAAIHGRLLSLRHLLNQGWPVDISTTDHVSPLHEACLGGHPSCASILLMHGAQVNAVSTDWHTPLFNACISGSLDCVNLLLQNGASPHSENDLASPIHEAAKRGANVNQGKDLDSPLHAAARMSSEELACLLMDFGANIQARNAEGKRPVDLLPPDSPLIKLFLQREGPSSLMELCRLRIRQCFGIQQHHKITELILPDTLKQFLLHLNCVEEMDSETTAKHD